MSVAVHRWFRYSAGFSAVWAREVVEQAKSKGRKRVLDPFAGGGTVALVSEACGMESRGVEAHPFVARVTQAKLNWHESPNEFEAVALTVLEEATRERVTRTDYPSLLGKCYPGETMKRLEAIRMAWERLPKGHPVTELVWLALCSILRECSPVGTAQWQYVLPGKSKVKVADPFVAFEARVKLFAQDMRQRQQEVSGPRAVVVRGDARVLTEVPDGWADLVLTSPPYANNYDYADATRLEMTFFGDIQGYSCLHGVRDHLVRSCTQHVGSLTGQLDRLLGEQVVVPIVTELGEACGALEKEKAVRKGHKNYHLMVAAYFVDMALVWQALRRVTTRDCQVCLVVGDSAPYGIHVPVDRWLGELAIAAGFHSFHFEKTRDRNIKWKNRKHRVPLVEGRLWVES